MKVIASIVTYNPEQERLKQNIDAICQQVYEIVIVDNGSSNIKNLKSIISSYTNIHCIFNNENLGIATALNKAAEYAHSRGYEWIITLDQDSVAPCNLVKTYAQYADSSKIGMLCCKIVDRNFGEMEEQKHHAHGVEEVPMCITSASMMNLKAWHAVGGFCDEMFIDSVDFDICLSMRETGYKIIKVNDVALLHEVGHSEIRRFLGKERQIYHHSPIRYYYMVRNGIYLGQRHHFFCRALYRVTRMAFFTLLFDDNKWEKMKMMSKGYYHAMKHKYGKLK